MPNYEDYQPKFMKKTPKKLEQELLYFFNEVAQRSFTLNNIASTFGMKKHKLFLEQILARLTARGLLKRTANNRFSSNAEPKQYVGIVDYTNPYLARILVETPKETEIWVISKYLMNALHGDKVRVKLIRKKGNTLDGKVIDIIQRRRTTFVGIVTVKPKYARVQCSDKKMHFDFHVPKQHLNEARSGQKVLVELLSWEKQSKPIGRIVQVLGGAGDHQTEMQAIMYAFELPFGFSETIEKAANKLRADITKTELKKRRDLRGLVTFTIDPPNAKDFDDALSIRKHVNGHWEIGIHIADVTHYVKPDTELDKAAYERATSVYLVDRTIPMLPEKLSNELCSLKPHRDRYAFSAIFELDDQANIKSEWFGKTIIHSNRRFTYDQVQKIIEKQQGEYAENVLALNLLATKLQKYRFDNGAISFETTEFRFELDKDGKVIALHPTVRNDAHKLVEEFMLLTNRRVASFIHRKNTSNDIPATMVYRIHEPPNADKLATLSRLARQFGYKINIKTEDAALALNALTTAVKGKPAQNAIEYQAIRSMEKAIYSTENIGHFGLSFTHYTHFTSPIRRYPDMMVHRLLQHCLANEKPAEKAVYEHKCRHTSMRERVAVAAERASIKYKQVEFMSAYIGEIMEGIITSVTTWGIFVELAATKCEGLVHISSMKDDHYTFIFDEKNCQLLGEVTGTTYRLGDNVRVRVMATNLEKRTIDFSIA